MAVEMLRGPDHMAIVVMVLAFRISLNSQKMK
jgi:hypothetical protein